ncbi:MAG TPA: caspase family protein [Pyrinomonadaceae bacterium]
MRMHFTHGFARSMRRKSSLCLMLLGSLGFLQVDAQQDHRQLDREKPGERRIALVIGNGAYANVPRLRNPSSDARLVAATLTKLGFEVLTGTDKSQREMKQMIREFGAQLRLGRAVGVFYFAGHGVQAKGRNYLIPVDADIQTEADLEDTAVDLNYVLNTMDDAQNALNIAILDACRNNPFTRSFRSTQDGLAQVVAPTGTLIAYATAPNSVAADGGGDNSPYTEELARQMEKPGVLLETMFRRVTEQVSARTGGRQEPWYAANVKGDFYFASGPVMSGNNNPSSPVLDPPEKGVPPKGGARLSMRPSPAVRPYRYTFTRAKCRLWT